MRSRAFRGAKFGRSFRNAFGATRAGGRANLLKRLAYKRFTGRSSY